MFRRISDGLESLNTSIGESTFGRVFRLEGSGHVSMLHECVLDRIY